jgi:dihydrofolate reductase
MRKVMYALSVSLDGFCEAANGDLSWSIADEELFQHFIEREARIDVHLYGRRLYETMAAYWPTADADPSASTPVVAYAKIWKAIPNIVFSKTLKQVGPNSRLARGNIADEVNTLKAQAGQDLIVGGAELAASFMQLDLIDEYRLYVQPVILGSGKPMFRPLRDPLNLQLVETRTFRSGVVLLKYHKTPARH